MIPDWLFNAIHAKLGNPDYIKPEDITMLIVNMKPTEGEKQVAAFINISSVNANFYIFEKIGNQYVTVFEDQLFVEGVQVVGVSPKNQILVVTGGGGGTGFWETYYYVIRYTPDGYKVVWQGIASNRANLELLGYRLQQYGMIGFDTSGKILTYAQKTVIPTQRGIFQIYLYNEQKGIYELSRTF